MSSPVSLASLRARCRLFWNQTCTWRSVALRERARRLRVVLPGNGFTVYSASSRSTELLLQVVREALLEALCPCGGGDMLMIDMGEDGASSEEEPPVELDGPCAIGLVVGSKARSTSIVETSEDWPSGL